mmetsp:Transcript_39233/g.45622  ORF Transcript_39233/g.45622 Transcript_39233/m.45622 type:complete len:94 (+) Transcript_39233:46-327(+)|eukprot:CAMPEP_0176446846 /NCGR_PEP_ID=MMETSP0127-20121128/24598_1 /TAXON_ID=938130 /ORGANISM="Platyophrya macrostoma, Strain WH" /LENGTH=93 /DNA_ID=CAMNT_0017833017 /DNA_START=45 /DNA_END=326 /DNA_ORIENTATION=+
MVSTNFVRGVGYVGAAANWLIPIAAVTNLMKQPASDINPQMTGILTLYSCVFMRWAIAINPANYPLLVCHVVNSTAQALTLGKYAMSEKKTTA